MSGATQDALAGDKNFYPGQGIDPDDLAAVMRQVGSPPGRRRENGNYFPPAPTVAKVTAALRGIVDAGDGIAVVNVAVRVNGQEYLHLVVIDHVTDEFVVLRDPEGTGSTRLPITADSFGAYVWTGDAIIARIDP